MGTYTLLRYPGGKHWATKYLLPFFLETGETQLLSPFFGGGALELALINKGWTVRAHDNFVPVVNFWKRVLLDPNRVADIAEMYRPVEHHGFIAMQKHYEQIRCPDTRAAVYYVLNRTAHSGNAFKGGIIRWTGEGPNARLNDRTITKLRGFEAPGLTVDEADFAHSIGSDASTLMYLDPPYIEAGDKLYVENDKSLVKFDHLKLAECLKGRGKWILSYGEHPDARELYKDYAIIPLKWHHGHQRQFGNELLIFSHDLSHLAELSQAESEESLTTSDSTTIIPTEDDSVSSS